MYRDNNQLKSPANDESLFRYMDFISFYSLLRNQTVYFRRLDKYSDKLEGQLQDETIADHIQWLQGIDPTMKLSEATRRAVKNAEHIKKYREWTLSSCWNLDANESYAMWKIYLKGSAEGVAIRTTTGKLKTELEKNPDFSFTGGKVTYEPLKHATVGQFSVSANKRPPYAYEKEFRALIINQYDKDTKSPLYEDGVAVKLEIDQLIDQVYISPFATGWFKSTVELLITDHLPEFEHENIIWSKIQDA